MRAITQNTDMGPSSGNPIRPAFPPDELIRLASTPSAPSPPANQLRIPWERFEAMMLCLAIGDSLGNTTESLLPAARRHRHGTIRTYLAHPRFRDARGYPSDDTQLSFWTLEHLLQHRRIEPARLLETFASRQIFGIGSTVREALRNFRQGLPWYECGVPSAGNGALMRIAPLAWHALSGRLEDAARDAILATVITHNDSMAAAASVASVQLLVQCCLLPRVPEPEWWAAQFVSILKNHETCFAYTSRAPGYAGWQGSLWQFLERYLLEPRRLRQPLEDALDWYSGAYLLETVPTCLLILMRYAGDPRQAMLRAVNDTKDNDTIAAIVGAFLGALHGKEWIPADWLEALSGRLQGDDEGALFEVLDRARPALQEPL